jgi:hypothetical protein
MGLEDIGDKIKKRDKEERADDLGLDSIDKLEDIDEVKGRLNDISQSHVSQDKRIEELEGEVNTLWKVLKILIEDKYTGEESAEEEDTEESEEEEKEYEEDYSWLVDDE